MRLALALSFCASAAAQDPGPSLQPPNPVGFRCPSEVAQLLDASPAELGYHGFDLLFTHGELLVGSPGDDAGAVHVYAELDGTWTPTDLLLPTGATAEQDFGWSLAADGDTLVVGAPGGWGFGSDPGAAFVFTRDDRSGWVQEARLVGDPGTDILRFGTAVDVDGDRLVVGAPFENTPTASVGGYAYVFERAAPGQWDFAQKLTGAVPSGGIFGQAAALDGDRLLIGAPYFGNELLLGRAFVFAHTGSAWQLEQQLMSPIATERDRFGSSVALVGDTAVIGAPRTPPPLSGLAAVFERQPGASWVSTQWFLAPQPTYNDQFGSRVEVRGGRLLVGAANHDDTGAAYLYAFPDGLAFDPCRLRAPDAAAFDVFGLSAALGAEGIAVGAPFRDGATSDEGAVYVFDDATLPSASAGRALPDAPATGKDPF